MAIETTMYARMYGGKRLHIVTGTQWAYVARCGAAPGVRGNWYAGQHVLSPYYPICKACEAAGADRATAGGRPEGEDKQRG